MAKVVFRWLFQGRKSYIQQFSCWWVETHWPGFDVGGLMQSSIQMNGKEGKPGTLIFLCSLLAGVESLFVEQRVDWFWIKNREEVIVIARKKVKMPQVEFDLKAIKKIKKRRKENNRRRLKKGRWEEWQSENWYIDFTFKGQRIRESIGRQRRKLRERLTSERRRSSKTSISTFGRDPTRSSSMTLRRSI